MEPIEVGKHLIVHPRVCFGKMTFNGTRVPVETVLTFLAMGSTIDEILADWPQLKREAVVEAIELARDALIDRYELPRKKAHEPARHGRSA